jgi:Flp pilus assembly protein TadG
VRHPTHLISISRQIARLRDHSPRRSESGAALVEFALVLPILMLVLLGIFQFGKGFNYWIDETHLANEAARFAVVNKNPATISGCSGGASLTQCILSQADTAELRDGGTTSIPTKPTVCISFPNGTSNVGDPVKATVTLTYHWMPVIRLTDTVISASATMRLEALPTNYSAGCSS